MDSLKTIQDITLYLESFLHTVTAMKPACQQAVMGKKVKQGRNLSSAHPAFNAVIKEMLNRKT